MKYISTPWREKYVKNVFKMKGCVFCSALKNQNNRESYILHRAKHNFIILNTYPYTPGHLMIAPFEHMDSVEKAKTECLTEFMDLLKTSLAVMREKYSPHGFNMGMNIGHSAGAGVADHYHLHVVPRWVGDSNFMPLISQTKVFMEDLQKTYDQLLPLFQEAK